jgi:hypothetical protein
MPCLLEEAGLINDQNRIIIGQCLKCIITHDVAQPISIPVAAAKNGLLAPGTGVTRSLCPHPAGLASLITKKAIKKLPRRTGNACLAEKRPYPRFYIP